MTNYLIKKQRNKPKVSILLPNLNNYRFLEERFQTIVDQTFTNWELVVVDSYSDDGAWELIQKYAKKDFRIKISQAPREGVYSALNRCIELAHGEYIYIATSDDTMTPDCLEQMVSALDTYKECDLCHCCLILIDEDGKEIENRWINWEKVKFFGDYIKQKHIRLAPHDGILYCSLGTVYTSLTQLLIRKTVFDKIGFFKTEFGSRGDFEWGLRASLVCNTVHIPDELASWRIHSDQATQNYLINSSRGQEISCKMIESALDSLQEKGFEIVDRLETNTLTFCYRFRQLTAGIYDSQKLWSKVIFLLKFTSISFNVVTRYLMLYTTKKNFDAVSFIRDVLTKLAYDKNIKICSINQNDCESYSIE